MNIRKIIKQLDIYDPNRHMQTPRETFRIGIAHTITGLVAILTLGRYSSGLAANVIGDVVVDCIHKRRTICKKKLEVIMKSKDLEKKITIGSDPEFTIFNTSAHVVVPAYDFFRNAYNRICKDMVMCDWRISKLCRIHNNFCPHYGRSAAIGCDGILGELRPKESRSPLIHTDNIQELLKELKPLLGDNHIIKAGTVDPHPMGGHIHIGIPKLTSREEELLSKYLSYYAGIPLKKIEKISDIKKRGWSRGYGYFGNHGYKYYGIEWRMPASWLFSKEITKAALCLAYTVAQHFIVAKETDIYCSPDEYHRLITGNITPIINKIKRMKYYKVYKTEIDPVFKLIKQKKTWDTNVNVMEKWDL